MNDYLDQLTGRTPSYKASLRPPSQSQADRIVQLALDRYDLGCTQEGDSFLVPRAGPRVVRMVGTTARPLRAELSKLQRAETGKVPNAAALSDALVAIDGLGRDETPTEVFLRSARTAPDECWIDLGRHDGRCARVTAEGWSIQDGAPVLFRRSALTGELPIPQRGGSLELLAPYLPKSASHRDLIVGFLVSATLSRHPVPGLALLGEQGTGKTTLSRRLVDLLDPSPASTQAMPRSEADWAAAAGARRVVAIDNVSGIKPWQSDLLCRAVTGDAIASRRLYTDADVVVARFQNVLILNGIDIGVLRGDLLDRLVLLELPPIPDHDRTAIRLLDSRWRHDRALILGAILTSLTRVLSLLDHDQTNVGRMADHEAVLRAHDRAHGSNLHIAYRAAVSDAHVSSIDGDLVAAAVLAHLEPGATWEGTASELLAALPVPQQTSGWPTTPQHMSQRLTRAAPALRRVGVTIDRYKTPDGRRRRINIQRL